MHRFGRGWIGLMAASLVGLGGCSNESERDGTSGASTGSGGALGNAGSGPSCARETTTPELVPLDVFVVLDTSDAMLETTSAGSNKWVDVANALLTFLRDAGSAGIGIGLTYFPIPLEDVPDTCTNDDACGAGGPCLSKICLNAFVEADRMHTCVTDEDCHLGTQFAPTCRTIGDCSAAPGQFCFTESAGSCDGTCTQSGICSRFVSCDPSQYGVPAVPLAELPESQPGLASSLQQRVPTGKAATAPALTGAIQQARAWAETHPDHNVITLLAVGGLATECHGKDVTTPSQAVGELADAARDGASDGVRTFVIGVFTANAIEAGARAHLNSVALAGDTEQAFVIDSSGNVTREFWSALNQIRGTNKPSCEFLNSHR